MQDLVHKIAKVQWMSHPGAPETEALGVRGEFVACKWRRKMAFSSNIRR